jgi:hypothetical protein
MATQVNNTAWLEWIEALMKRGAESRTSQAAALPPDLFHCLLDELPLHLISQRQLRSLHNARLSDQPLFLNPHCSILPPGQIPQELRDQPHLFEKFASNTAIAWIRDPLFDAVQPFWLGDRLAPIVSHLKPTEPVSGAISEHDLAVLAAAGILVEEKHAEKQKAEWSQIVENRSSLFRYSGYAPLSNLIHPFHIAALRRYYRRQIRRGSIRLGDDQSARRYVAHNETVARFFHQQLTNAVSAVVGEPVKPSYVYFASYLCGAELKKHIDREQCEFSVTLCLDFSPEPELATSWPIRVDTPEGSTAIYQALGDGLVYRGTKVPHYRSVLPAGYTSASIFFHYVPASFSGSLE